MRTQGVQHARTPTAIAAHNVIECNSIVLWHRLARAIWMLIF